MKQRLTLTDLNAVTNELNDRLAQSFIQNFYSTQQRFIYIKFSNKDTLLIEPGFRMHLTQSCDTEISHFCKKLREKCRHAKVQRIYRFGFDRVVVIDIQRVKIVIEFFSAGNMIIVDENDTIVDLLRPVPELGMTKGSKYHFNFVDLDLSFARFKSVQDLSVLLPLEKEHISIFKKSIEDRFEMEIDKLRNDAFEETVGEFLEQFKEQINSFGGFGEVTLNKGKPEQIFAFATESSQVLNLNSRPSTVSEKKDEITDGSTMKDAVDGMKNLSLKKKYSVLLKPKEDVESMIQKNKAYKAIHFGSFNEAAEYYFSGSKKQKKEKEDKNTRIRKAQEKYIEELDQQAAGYTDIATVLNDNRQFVDEILSIFNKVFEKKIEWSAFESFWEDEKRRGNSHANTIVSFDLDTKKCIVKLDDYHIELDIDKSLNKNIEIYYSKRRRAIEKGDKTKVALEGILEKISPKKMNVPAQKRDSYWFEKFNFFITTDEILVIGGKNAQQNEMIVKKYMDATDIYFHCDVHGASSVVCKGRTDVAIQEASYMALCMSKCWEEGVIKQVFYVDPDQVSKSAPTGEYITKGSFMIKGKKNILSPYRLEYGIGLIFKLEGASNLLEFSTKPSDEDKIVHAMPVAAPWICVKEYKYRIRLCPGGEKKSKICQDIMNSFSKQSEGRSEEKCVKAVGIDEYMSVVLGKSKIAKIV